MDVSASEVLLSVVLISCVVGVGVGIRWISRRADADMERTRSLLRSRHAVIDEPVVPQQSIMPQQSIVAPRQPIVPHAVSNQQPSVVAGAGAVPDAGPDLDDPESSGRHRVPEELMRASTYWLSPDRVARAKVPSMRTDENSTRARR